MTYDRRTLLRLGGLAAVGTLAGCSGGSGTDGTDTATGTTAASTTTATPASSAGGAPPGRDRLGGPNELQASATVTATTLDSDRGAGRYVFTPAVVWLEPGGTITWEIESGSHSATAYHPDNGGKPARIPGGGQPFDSGIKSGGSTFEHTFETEGAYNYFCKPHESLGMVGLVVVGRPQGGPGTTSPDDVGSSTAATNLTDLLSLAGVGGDGAAATEYGWQAATWDSYWYSLYNMSTNIAMSGNGVQFPHTDAQRRQFRKRIEGITKAADVDRPPINNPNLNMAPFTEGDPHFTQRPVFEDDTGRPDADTLTWDPEASSGVVSPSSVAWTHLKGVTWAKNFEAHFDILPADIAPKFRAQVLSTLAQIGTKATLIAGGPDGNGVLTAGDDSLRLVSGFRPRDGTVTDATPRVHHHAAMLWFLSDMVSLARGGWFGYENPSPLLPARKIQRLADGLFETTSTAFPASEVSSTRDAGLLLGAIGWYGTHAGSERLRTAAVDYATALADRIDATTESNGRVTGGADNQAATQGIVGQGLLWASEIDGVDRSETAEAVLGYLTETLWNDDAGVFAAGTDTTAHTYTVRDAGDIVGGLNAADAVLGVDGVKPRFARFFDQAFNRGRLQRAQRPPSVDEGAQHPLPLPPKAGGEFGQAAVYNAEVEYDATADTWSVTDGRFDTEGALYLANQDIWIGQWGGDFYQGRGRPGHSDEPPA